MAPRSTHPRAIRACRGIGLASLVGGVAWVSGRFEARPYWPLGFPEVASILLWALGLHMVLRLVAALTRGRDGPSWTDYARGYALLILCCGTFMMYFNACRVGPLDAQWYENVTQDYLAQARGGTFPVMVGSTVFAFNGAVHPFRSAPWQFVFADGIDFLTGRSLAPVAVEHMTAIASFCAAVLILYVGFARARPASLGLAWLFALIYAMSPAATVPFFQYDMYMTLTAQPAMAAALLCVARLLDDDSFTASGWLGVCLAALWYCHPPMALLTGLVAGGCAAAGLATRGATPRRLCGAAIGVAVFGALAGPYFSSMSEIAQSDQPRLATFGMPLAALGLCLLAMAGFLRTRRLAWLAPMPTALLCLWGFQPSLVPFAGCFTAAMLVAAGMTRRHARRNDVAWVSLCALAAAIFACGLFARVSVPDRAAWIPHAWEGFLRPIIALSGTRVQPGYLMWLLVVGMIVSAFAVRSVFAQAAAAAALVLAVSFGFCGPLSAFLWRNTPGDVSDVIGIAYDLRLVPVMAVVAVTGGFYWLASLGEARPRLRRALIVLVLLLVPWSLWEEGMVLYLVHGFRIDLAQTAARNRSENVALERYSWDLLAPSSYMNFGVMDPALETRFWSDGDRARPAVGPDQIERALEAPGQQPIPVLATPIATGKDWLTLEPRIELDPGQHVLLRFDFLGRHPAGFLVVRGQAIYREYQLPASGLAHAFGFDAENPHTLSLWNSGATHESVQFLIDRSGPHAFDPPGPEPYWLMYQTPYDPKRAPIELYSLTPLRLRVDAPTAGYVETFRSLIPGYKVYVDGVPAAVHRSRNALVAVRVSPGSHDLWVRFAGTVRLHTALRWAATAWVIAAVAAAIQLGVMARRRC